MIPLFLEYAEICIVGDNAKTHTHPMKPTEEPRQALKRSASLPMDLDVGSRRRRRGGRRATRRGSVELPSSRWSAGPSSPPRFKKEVVAHQPNGRRGGQAQGHHENSVLHNVLKPVRQGSLEDLNNEESCGNLPEVRKAASFLPMKKPVRQHSLRELVVSCSPQKGQSPPTTKVDTVELIAQALEQLDSLSELDNEMEGEQCSYQSLPEIVL